MGQVLMSFDPNVIMDRVCETKEEKTIIDRELFQSPVWIMGDKGEITNAMRYDLVRPRVPEYLWDKLKECVENWCICMKPLAGAIPTWKKLKREGYRVYVLSNACDRFYDYFPGSFPLEEWDGVVVSSDVKLIKPDKAIYELILKKYDLVADECIFLDDRTENIQGANTVGMHGIRFEGSYDVIWKEIARQNNPEYGFRRMENSLVDLIKEEQAKLGYRREMIHLYYPLSTLNHFFETDGSTEQMQSYLDGFGAFVRERLGEVAVSHKGDRFCFQIPEEGSAYVHEKMRPNEFIQKLVDLIGSHQTDMEQIFSLFREQSEEVLIEPIENGEFDYLCRFTDSEDEYYYCFKQEGYHIIYHRFLPEDYKEIER